MSHIDIPSGVNLIGDRTFFTCPISSVVLPDSVKKIGEGAFQHCRELKEIRIPKSVKEIGGNSFDLCDKLERVELPPTLDYLPYHAFSRCENLADVVWPKYVKTIGNSAFQGCRNLKTVELSDSLATIQDFAFNDCEGLSAIELPASLKTLGNDVFGGCPNLTKVTSMAVVPPGYRNFGIVGQSVVYPFANVDKTMCELVIPAQSYDLYKNSPVWEDFFKDGHVSTGIEEIENDTVMSDDTLVDVFDLRGVAIARGVRFGDLDNLAGGAIYILRTSQGRTFKYMRR